MSRPATYAGARVCSTPKCGRDTEYACHICEECRTAMRLDYYEEHVAGLAHRSALLEGAEDEIEAYDPLDAVDRPELQRISKLRPER